MHRIVQIETGSVPPFGNLASAFWKNENEMSNTSSITSYGSENFNNANVVNDENSLTKKNTWWPF